MYICVVIYKLKSLLFKKINSLNFMLLIIEFCIEIILLLIFIVFFFLNEVINIIFVRIYNVE